MTGLSVLHGASSSPHETFIQSPGAGWRISAANLRSALAKSATLREHLLHYAHAYCVQIGYTALANARYKLDERLARWLLMAQDRGKSGHLSLYARIPCLDAWHSALQAPPSRWATSRKSALIKSSGCGQVTVLDPHQARWKKRPTGWRTLRQNTPAFLEQFEFEAERQVYDRESSIVQCRRQGHLPALLICRHTLMRERTVLRCPLPNRSGGWSRWSPQSLRGRPLCSTKSPANRERRSPISPNVKNKKRSKRGEAKAREKGKRKFVKREEKRS